MLSIFPEFLDWAFLVPFIFRIFLSLYFFKVGFRVLSDGDTDGRSKRLLWALLGSITLATGALFFIGLYVQLAAISGFLLAAFALLLKHSRGRYAKYTLDTEEFHVLVALVSLSLLALGPGPYSIDLPL